MAALAATAPVGEFNGPATSLLGGEVAGNVQDQLRQPGRVSVDGAIGRRHDRHVRKKE